MSKTKVTDIAATGTRDETTFLRGDGTWSVPEGEGGGGNPEPYGRHLYWRFLARGSVNNSYLGLAELSLFKVPGDANSATTGGTALGSTFESAYDGSTANPANVFDNNPSTRWVWYVGATSSGLSWVGYQFSSPVSITAIAIDPSNTPSNSRPSAGDIEYSDNGSVWIKAWSITEFVSPYTAITASISPDYSPGSGELLVSPTDKGPSGYLPSSAPHKWWRINVLNNYGYNGQTSAIIAEIQFRTVPGTPQLVGSGIAFAGNWLSDNVPARAFDNNPSTFWHTAGVMSYVGWHYDTAIAVQEVQITLRDTNGLDGGPKNFSVDYSDDGINWITQWDVEGAGFTAPSQTRVFTDPNSGDLTNYYPTDLAALNDVDTQTDPPTDAQVLTWDVITGKWVPRDPTGGGGGGGGGGGAADFGEHLYWRLWFPYGAGQEYAFAINEVQMRATIGGVDQCVGGTPSGNAWEGSSVPANAFDDNPSTFWALNFPSSEYSNRFAWLQYTFAAAVKVGEILVRARSDAPKQMPQHIFVQYSDDDLKYTTAWDFGIKSTSLPGAAEIVSSPLLLGGGGSGRLPWYTGGEPGLPVAADFAVIQSSTDFTIDLFDESDGLHMTISSGGPAATDRTGALEKPLTGLIFDFQALIVGQNYQREYQQIGVYCRNSTTGRLVTCGIGEGNTRGWNCLRWNSLGAYNGSYTNKQNPMPAWPLWMRIRGDGTTMFFEISSNGKYWTFLRSVAFADFVGAADRVGMHYVASQVGEPQNIPEHVHLMDYRFTQG